MLTLVNTNRMTPPIAPVGLDYLAGAARQAGEPVELLDLCLVDDPDRAVAGYFADRRPDLVPRSRRGRVADPRSLRTLPRRRIRDLLDLARVVPQYGYGGVHRNDRRRRA